MRHDEDFYRGFGLNDPRCMPAHFFWDSSHIDYATAVRADISQQDFTVAPRLWYVDATFCCARCAKSFVFSAQEQKFWYEELKFFVDSLPKHCSSCRRELRELKNLRQDYDRDVAIAMAGDARVELKLRMVAAVNALDQLGVPLPDKTLENRCILEKQIEKLQRDGDEYDSAGR